MKSQFLSTSIPLSRINAIRCYPGHICRFFGSQPDHDIKDESQKIPNTNDKVFEGYSDTFSKQSQFHPEWKMKDTTTSESTVRAERYGSDSINELQEETIEVVKICDAKRLHGICTERFAYKPK